uniref:Uncharacterized protein n=1 Tax=viral metagenome TaxID=1070528 RepID=A0A6C0I8H9_9ZZZZ
MNSKKVPEFGIKKTINTDVIESKVGISAFAKWVPLVCAGAAVGVSILALKEIKNVRKDLINMKKETLQQPDNEDLNKKIELMDEQLRKITQYLSNQTKQKQVKKEPEKIIKEVVKEEVKIINSSPEEQEEVEYIEVTDDES